MASQIGAYGCGKKAAYVYYPDSDTWLLDGPIGSAPEAPPEAPLETPTELAPDPV